MNDASTAEGETNELRFGRIVRRLLLYLGLAFAGLAVIALLLSVTIHFGITNYLAGGWIGFVGYTGLLFWIIVRGGRQHWYRGAFWSAIVGLLATHCLVFVAILRVYPQWRMIWFWPLTVVEAGIIGGALEWVFPEARKRHHGGEDL